MHYNELIINMPEKINVSACMHAEIKFDDDCTTYVHHQSFTEKKPKNGGGCKFSLNRHGTLHG